jgi:hypothetical protein
MVLPAMLKEPVPFGGGGPCPSHRTGSSLTAAGDIRQLTRGTAVAKRAGRVAEGKTQVTHSLASAVDLCASLLQVCISPKRQRRPVVRHRATNIFWIASSGNGTRARQKGPSPQGMPFCRRYSVACLSSKQAMLRIAAGFAERPSLRAQGALPPSEVASAPMLCRSIRAR